MQGKLPVPEVLHVDLVGGPIGRPYALLSLLPSEPLSRVEDDLPENAIADLGRAIGMSAARMHAERFEGSGFFAVGRSGELQLPDPLISIRGPYEALSRKCLSTPVLRERLGDRLTDELTERFARHADLVWSRLDQARLTHSDFNQKNILVAQVNGTWTVTGLLDFEFAHSGSGLDDLGNFLRFDEEQPNYGPTLVEGYLAAGGSLPPEWRLCTHYLDLVPMMQILARPNPGPRTVATVCSVIAAHLKALADGWGRT